MSSNSKNSNFKTQYLDIAQDPFIFVVNGQEFKCNKFGVNVSGVIRKLRSKDSTINKYDYISDISNSAFQDICNIFNFKKVQITQKNMKSLLKISEDLEIDVLLDDIKKYIDFYETSLEGSEKIDQIFEWLYQIESLTVETVKNSIVNSEWSHTEENVQELAAVILQVIRTSYKLHPFLIDLITSLQQSSEEGNDLRLLTPIIVKQLLFSFHKSILYCSFVYKLVKIGQISIENIVDRICSIDRFLSDKIKKNVYDESFSNYNHSNVAIWFFPELVELKPLVTSEIQNGLTNNESSFIQFYLSPKNINKFKKMRDSYQPSDELTLSILHDDVDKFQQIITGHNININKGTIPLNIFDVFDRNIEKSYINYACECGSIKTFKYLMLNHAKFDDLSLGFAIFGGNTEIIRIVEQQINNKSKENFIVRKNNNNALYSFYNQSNYLNSYQNNGVNYSLDINCVLNPIIPSIVTHNYDLLSWILDQQFQTKKANELDIDVLVNIAAQNGNANAFIKFMDQNIFTSINYHKFIELILLAAKSGFYRFIQFLFKFNNVNDIVITSKQEDLEFSSIYFGNLSIFKLLNGSMQSNCNFPHLLEFAIQREYLNIIEYIFNNLYIPKENKVILKLFKSSINLKTATIFNFIESKISLSDFKYNFNAEITNFQSILKTSIESKNIECFQKITDFINKEYPNTDFSDYLISAAKLKCDNFCEFFIEKKVTLKSTKILQNYQHFLFGTDKLIQNLINYFDSNTKENLSKLILQKAIKLGKKNIIDLLISKDLLNKEALFDAVETRNIDIVNKVLQYNDKPWFINQISEKGSVLNIAVSNNDIEIVQRLLNISKINVNLYDQTNGDTPLILAISKNNVEIAQMLIEHPDTDINMKNFGYQSPLLIAAKNKLKFIITLLVKNEKFDPEESELNYVFAISEGNIARQLVSVEGLDVNYKLESYLFETSLNHANLMNDLEKIELIISHKSFDPIKSQIKDIIESDFINLNESFFKNNFDKFVKDVNMNLNGKPFFVFCSEHHLYEILKLIMKKDSFNPTKNDFNKAFINFLSNPNEKNQEILKEMIEFDSNHNHLIDYDKSLLYAFARIRNDEIMNTIQKVFDANENKENVKFSVYPSFDKPGIIYKLKTMETSPFDPLFVASQSSADIYNLVDYSTGDNISLYCNEKCFIEFEFADKISINGIYLIYDNQDFINLFDVFIDDNKVEVNIENLDDNEITISFDPILCKKLTFKIKESFGNTLKNDFIVLNGIELFSLEEKYSKGIFATLIENNEFKDPHKCPFIISSSGYDFNSFYLTKNSHGISTYDEKDSWFQIEFTHGLVILDGFRLKRTKSNKLKGFKIVSTDDENNPIENWITLYEFNEKFNEFNSFEIFQFEHQSNPTKFIRIIQTEPNWDCNFHLILIHIDFFGSYL